MTTGCLPTTECTPRHTPREARSILRERARRIMKHEIAFIPHADFPALAATESAGETWTRINALSCPSPAPAPAEQEPKLPRDYLRVVRTDLLSPAEEQRLFHDMNFLKYRANVLRSGIDPRRPDERQLDLIEALLALAQRQRDRLVEANLRLVLSLAKQCAAGKSCFDEVVSEGLFTLLRAVEKFDFSRGYRLSTYATHAIRRNVFRLLMQDQKDRNRLAAEAAENIPDRADEREPAPLMEARWERLRGDLARLMVRLDPRERLVVRARFGLGRESEPQTLQSLAGKLGVCKERVRQLEQRALEKLRRMAETLHLGD